MACLRLVTFLPLRPLRSLPRFIARISRSTSLPAPGEYLRPDFRVDFFLPEDFPADDLLFVAICISFRVRWQGDFRRLSACGEPRRRLSCFALHSWFSTSTTRPIS